MALPTRLAVTAFFRALREIRGRIIKTTDTLLKINDAAAEGNSSTSLTSSGIGKCAPRLMSIGLLVEANIETRQLNQLKQQASIYRANSLKRICRRSTSHFRALSKRTRRTKSKEKLTGQKKNQDNCNPAAPSDTAFMALFTIRRIQTEWRSLPDQRNFIGAASLHSLRRV